MTKPRQINTPEDWSEYKADKGLHEAYKNRANVPTVEQLIRKWVEHLSAEHRTNQPKEK